MAEGSFSVSPLIAIFLSCLDPFFSLVQVPAWEADLRTQTSSVQGLESCLCDLCQVPRATSSLRVTANRHCPPAGFPPSDRPVLPVPMSCSLHSLRLWLCPLASDPAGGAAGASGPCHFSADGIPFQLSRRLPSRFYSNVRLWGPAAFGTVFTTDCNNPLLTNMTMC